MKKALILILALWMALVLAACGLNSGEQQNTPSPSTSGKQSTSTGGTELYQGFLAGEVDFATFDDNATAKYVAAGDDLVVGAVAADERSSYFPDAAAAAEWGCVGLEANIGFKVLAVRADTPDEICSYLRDAFNQVILSQEYRSWCSQNYYASVSGASTSEEIYETLCSVRDLNEKILSLQGLI